MLGEEGVCRGACKSPSVEICRTAEGRQVVRESG